MSSRDRLWATVVIWTAVTIVLTSLLVKANVWLVQGDVALVSPGFLLPTQKITIYETDGNMVIGLVSIVVIVIVGATIATVGVWGQLRKSQSTK